MSSENLGLENIVLDDTINGTMLQKINTNMRKVEEKYGELEMALLEQTGKETLEDAIAYVQILANDLDFLNSSGIATASDILSGKTAVVRGEIVTGTIPNQPAQTITPRNSKQNNCIR